MQGTWLRKDTLLRELRHDPLGFSSNNGMSKLLLHDVTLHDARLLVQKIYDLNPNQLTNMSNANSGMIGFLNKISSLHRSSVFRHRVNNQKAGRKYHRIYVEGDSWFQFPVFLSDVVDHLGRNANYLIRSDAYGGDWITNILAEEQYVSGLSTYHPEVFLVSGGGNDLVGSHRFAHLVSSRSNYGVLKYQTPESIPGSSFSDSERQSLFGAQKFVNREFYSILLVLELQYHLLFRRLYRRESTQKEIFCVTQGYDYALPTKRYRFAITRPLQPILNCILKSGNWLYTPLMIKGITSKLDQRAIVKLLIFEFNEMLSKFSNLYPRVYHIDSRGLTKSEEDWYDELHLRSNKFRRVAEAYSLVIENLGNPLLPKVIQTTKIDELRATIRNLT